MKKYKVHVTESVLRSNFVIINAESREEAEKTVEDMYLHGDFYFEPNQTEIIAEPLLTEVYAEEVEE